MGRTPNKTNREASSVRPLVAWTRAMLLFFFICYLVIFFVVFRRTVRKKKKEKIQFSQQFSLQAKIFIRMPVTLDFRREWYLCSGVGPYILVRDD